MAAVVAELERIYGDCGNVRGMAGFGGLDYIVRDALLAVARRYNSAGHYYTYERDIVVDVCRELSTRCPELAIDRETGGVRTGLLKTEWGTEGTRQDLLIIDPTSVSFDSRGNIEAYTLVELEIKHHGRTLADLKADVDVLATGQDKDVLSVAFSFFRENSANEREKWRALARYCESQSKYGTLCAFSNLGATGLLSQLSFGAHALVPAGWEVSRNVPIEPVAGRPRIKSRLHAAPGDA